MKDVHADIHREFASFERAQPLPMHVTRRLTSTRTQFEPSWAVHHPTTLYETSGSTRPKRTKKGWRKK